ncbi:MAG: hypothetical protein HC830_13740 [Bacteroidetes bacterium]|nr:hypothetical protein [Bacteroidota bacterium]
MLYRKHPDLLRIVKKIAEGAGHADMIQDLFDAAVLGEENPEPLKAINFDMQLLTQAQALARQMSKLLAKANGAQLADNKQKELRDKAYTYMKQAVDEIRTHGHYVFWRNPEKEKGYTCNYTKRRNSETKKHGKKPPEIKD